MGNALALLNQECRDVGVCPSVSPQAEVEAKKVVELYHPDKPWKGLLVLWGDKRWSLCWKNDKTKEVQCCSESEKPEEDVFYMIQAFYTEPGEKMGFRSRELHKE